MQCGVLKLILKATQICGGKDACFQSVVSAHVRLHVVPNALRFRLMVGPYIAQSI